MPISTRPKSPPRGSSCERILPQAGALLFTIKAGKAPIMDMAEEAF